jgi:hypothetical protein
LENITDYAPRCVAKVKDLIKATTGLFRSDNMSRLKKDYSNITLESRPHILIENFKSLFCRLKDEIQSPRSEDDYRTHHLRIIQFDYLVDSIAKVAFAQPTVGAPSFDEKWSTASFEILQDYRDSLNDLGNKLISGTNSPSDKQIQYLLFPSDSLFRVFQSTKGTFTHRQFLDHLKEKLKEKVSKFPLNERTQVFQARRLI